MKDQIIFSILGGLLGYIGALFQHRLESKRLKSSEVRQEKMRIYSNVLTELSSLFMNPEKLIDELSDPTHKRSFALRLGRILGPARLVASDKLEEMLRDLFDKEVAWHDSMESSDTEKQNELSQIATTARMNVEREMRKEIKAGK
ncbi:hypothetical protein LDC_0018 [sediment metagenome]|uniref:Uncharacterized protein n=1 Tax=sediment metagenome TaxID=749907 RepID=D9PEU0_9ZZZZ